MTHPEFPDFAWGSGEESSDPLVPFEGEVVRVDELASTGHLEHMEGDLADAASLGITAWRYGMPWRLTERSPGEYDWALWDRALAGCEAAGLTPTVDLLHFGLPDHYPGFVDPAWVEGFVRYAEAFLARYPEPRWFTPVNEHVTIAAQCGLFGNWNDCRRSPDDYATIIAHCALAELEAFARIRADRAGWNVGAEVLTVPLAAAEASQAAADYLWAGQMVTWDLRFGHDLDPLVAGTLDRVDPRVMDRIAELATTEATVAGHDFYPVSVMVMGEREDPLTIGERVGAYAAAARRWHERYGVDFWVAETSNLGLPASEGSAWLEAMTNALFDLRRDGLPARGLCWYSRGDQHDWATALTRPVGAVDEVGLFDVARRPRPVADAFRRLTVAPVPPVGSS